MLIYQESQAWRLKEDLQKYLSESLLEGLSLSKISGMRKAETTTIMDLLKAKCILISIRCAHVIDFFLALGFQKDLGKFLSGQRDR